MPIRTSSPTATLKWLDLSIVTYLKSMEDRSCHGSMRNSTNMLRNKVKRAKVYGKFTITVYYVTSDTNSITHGLTSYLRCRNKLLLAHRPIIQVSAVESKSIWDTCTTPTSHLIIDESTVNQTKSSLPIWLQHINWPYEQLFPHCILSVG